MASERQRRRDELARLRGYKNYYDQRNQEAKAQGYRSLADKQKARRTGRGQVGSDRNRRRGVVTASPPSSPLSAPPRVPGGPSRRFSDTVDMERMLAGPTREMQLMRANVLTEFNSFAEKLFVNPKSKSSIPIRKGDPSLRNPAATAKAVEQHLFRAAQEGDKFYKQLLPNIFLEGYRQGAGDPDALPDEASVARIRAIMKRSSGDVEKAAIGAQRSSLAALQRTEFVKEGYAKSRLRRNGLRSVVYNPPPGHTRTGAARAGARQDFDKYMIMSMRANAVRSFNEGFLNGAAKRGVKMFEVSDGEDCGWSYHGDPERANGKVVTLEEAQTYPLAHPHCVRQFIARPDLQPGGKKKEEDSKAKAAAKQAVKAAVVDSLQQTAKATLREFVRQTGIDQKIKQAILSDIKWAKQYEANLDLMAKTTFRGVVDPDTGDIIPLTRNKIADDVMTYADDHAAGKAVPAHAQFAMQRERQQVRARAVGDDFDAWHDYYDRTVSPRLSIAGDSPNPSQAAFSDDFRDSMFEEAMSFAKDRFGDTKYTRYTQPIIKGKETGFQARDRLIGKFKFARATITRTDKGFINHMRLNPNGLLRFGGSSIFEDLDLDLGDLSIRKLLSDPTDFERELKTKFPALWRTLLDQLDQTVMPQMSIVPKGPIRVITKVNRGTQGNITSLSTEIRVITPKAAIRRANEWLGLTDNGEILEFLGKAGVDFSTSININLRQLGINRLSDVKNITWEGWKELSQRVYVNPLTGQLEDHPAVKWVSAAAKVRLSGGSMYDISKTFRITNEEAHKIWMLADRKIRADWLAANAQKVDSKIADLVRKAEDISDLPGWWADNALRVMTLNPVESIGKARVAVPEATLEDYVATRAKKRINVLPVHPYTATESRARKGVKSGIGNVSLINKNLDPLSSLPRSQRAYERYVRDQQVMLNDYLIRTGQASKVQDLEGWVPPLAKVPAPPITTIIPPRPAPRKLVTPYMREREKLEGMADMLWDKFGGYQPKTVNDVRLRFGLTAEEAEEVYRLASQAKERSDMDTVVQKIALKRTRKKPKKI